MKAIDEGIYNRCTTATAFGATIKRRIYPDIIPQNTLYPCADWSIISITEYAPQAYTTNYYKEAEVQFDLYSDKTSSTEINKMYSDLLLLYDRCTLSATSNGYKVLQMLNTFSAKDRFVEEVGTKSIWRYTVKFDMLMRKL